MVINNLRAELLFRCSQRYIPCQVPKLNFPLVMGIARELSALRNIPLKELKYSESVSYEMFEPLDSDQVSIDTNGIYSLVNIEEIQTKDNLPNWIIDRIEKSGVKSINPIVDITNYVMLETGQPLHAFDADKLNQLACKKVSQEDFGLRKANDNEEFLALDNNKYALTKDCYMITCCDISIAIAGVIGGLNTAVNSNTKSIWLEAAVFPPTMVRNSSSAVGLRTESSSRFEKGISPLMTIPVSKRAVDLINSILELS